MITKFDYTKDYEEEVAPIIAELRRVCSENRMPMFVSVCVKNDNSGTVYKNEMISAVSSGIVLKEDHMVNHVNVMNGFATVPSLENEKFDAIDDLEEKDQ